MAGLFENHGKFLDSPAQKAFAITPSDESDLALTTRAIYTGAGGTIVAILLEDTAPVTFVNVPAGSIMAIRAKKVLATGTTAAMGLIGLT